MVLSLGINEIAFPKTEGSFFNLTEVIVDDS